LEGLCMVRKEDLQSIKAGVETQGVIGGRPEMLRKHTARDTIDAGERQGGPAEVY